MQGPTKVKAMTAQRLHPEDAAEMATVKASAASMPTPLYVTYLCVHQQRTTVWQTKADRQPHFCWAAELFIDLEGNIIKVADGSFTKKKTKYKWSLWQ